MVYTFQTKVWSFHGAEDSRQGLIGYDSETPPPEKLLFYTASRRRPRFEPTKLLVFQSQVGEKL